MGVYIDMEMPKNEPLLVKINPDGSVSTTAKNGYKKYEAVPVQPHGRLIDADVLKDLYHFNTHDSDIDKAWTCNIRRSIDNAPTVIKAEEG